MPVQTSVRGQARSTDASKPSQLNWWDVTLQLLQIVAAGAALFGWITLVGGARVYARFQASEFPSPIRTVTLVPRDALFAEGLRALWKPLLLGAVGATLWYLVLRRDETRRARVRAALDARFGGRYQSGNWAGTTRMPGGVDPDFRRYVELRRRDEFGDVSSARADALLAKLDDGEPRDSWWRSGSELRNIISTAWTAWLKVALVVALIAGAVAGVISALGDIDFVPALILLGAIPVALLLAWLAYRVASAALQKSFVIFASVVVIWGLVLLTWEWGKSHPKLDYVYIALKDKTARLQGAYVARLDGDVYWAYKEPKKKDKSGDSKGEQAYERTWLITTPADEIEQLAIAADEGKPPDLPPDKPTEESEDDINVRVFPIPPTPTPTATPPDRTDMDVTPPRFLPLRAATADLTRHGAFGARLVRFDERTYGVARFITRRIAEAGHRRLPLGARVFQAEKGRAPVLRIVLAPRARAVMQRAGVVPVVVRITAVDSAGNSARASACVVVFSRRYAKRGLNSTRRCNVVERPTSKP